MRFQLKILFILLFLFSGCVSYDYSFRLNKPVVSDDMYFRDSIIEIKFKVDETSVNFELKNLSKDTIRVIWDSCFIKLDSKPRKIFHQGISLFYRIEMQPPAVITTGNVLKDKFTPVANVHRHRGRFHSSWNINDLFTTYNRGGSIEIEKQVMEKKGTTFEILLALEKAGKAINYPFEFLITDIKAH